MKSDIPRENKYKMPSETNIPVIAMPVIKCGNIYLYILYTYHFKKSL